METSNWEGHKTGETAPDFQSSGKTTGFENVKNSIADGDADSRPENRLKKGRAGF